MLHSISELFIHEPVLVRNIKLVKTESSTRVTEAALEDKINKAWCQQQAEAARAGKVLTDLLCYRLNTYSRYGDQLSLEIAPIQYKMHSAMKRLHGDPSLRPEHRDNTLIADGLVRTSDN